MSWPPLNVALSRLLCASYVLSDVLIAVPMSFANYLLYIKGQNPGNIMCCVLLKFSSASLFFFMLDSNVERLLAYSPWKIEGCKWEKKCINNKFLFLFTLWMDESKKKGKKIRRIDLDSCLVHLFCSPSFPFPFLFFLFVFHATQTQK